MSTIIAGHNLTPQQVTVLDLVLLHLRQHGGDFQLNHSTSPKGDGRWVPVLEIFPARDNHHNGLRRIVASLARKGVLAACEVTYRDGAVKAERQGA